jgi:hypothetical protein
MFVFRFHNLEFVVFATRCVLHVPDCIKAYHAVTVLWLGIRPFVEQSPWEIVTTWRDQDHPFPLKIARSRARTRGGARGNPSRFGGLMVLLVAGLSMIRSCYSRRSAIAFAGRVQFVRISLMWSFEGLVVCPSLFHVTFISIEATGCRIT